MKHPFPYIPEIAHIKEVSTFKDVWELCCFVYSTIMWTNIQFNVAIKEVGCYYKKFKNRELGGWCGLNSEFFSSILIGYGIENRIYDYGFSEDRFTHMVNIVQIEGSEYLFGAYLCQYYANLEGIPLKFDDLICLIKNKEYEKIVPVYGDQFRKLVIITMSI